MHMQSDNCHPLKHGFYVAKTVHTDFRYHVLELGDTQLIRG